MNRAEIDETVDDIQGIIRNELSPMLKQLGKAGVQYTFRLTVDNETLQDTIDIHVTYPKEVKVNTTVPKYTKSLPHYHTIHNPWVF